MRGQPCQNRSKSRARCGGHGCGADKQEIWQTGKAGALFAEAGTKVAPGRMPMTLML